MKLTKEIDLRGKSKEELNYLEGLTELTSLHQYNYLHFNEDFGGWWEFDKWDDDKITKQEVTIEQLKEILQPMGTFTPIAMRCTQEQFEAIKPKLKGLKIWCIDSFSVLNYLTNNLGEQENLISNVMESSKGNYNRTVHEEWNEEIFLKACGIEVDTLEQQLEKAEAEVKRLREAVEEENNIKIGDWVKRKNLGIEIFKADNTHDYRYINSEKGLYQKITDSVLLESLNKLF